MCQVACHNLVSAFIPEEEAYASRSIVFSYVTHTRDLVQWLLFIIYHLMLGVGGGARCSIRSASVRPRGLVGEPSGEHRRALPAPGTAVGIESNFPFAQELGKSQRCSFQGAAAS